MRAAFERSRVACLFYVVGPDPRNRKAPRIKKNSFNASSLVYTIRRHSITPRVISQLAKGVTTSRHPLATFCQPVSQSPAGHGNHAIPEGVGPASVNKWRPSAGRPDSGPCPGRLARTPFIRFKASRCGQLRSMRARIIWESSWRDRASTSLPTFSRTMA